MPWNLTRSREITRETCIRAWGPGQAFVPSYVFDATSLTADGNGRFIVPIGTFLTVSPADPTKVKVFEALGTDTDAQQTVTITGTPTGGDFTLTFNGQTTDVIAFDATAADVVAALEALSSVGTGNVTGAGGALPDLAVVITFTAALGDQPQPLMTSNDGGLTGGTAPAVTVTTTTPGETAEKIIGVFDGPTNKDFWGDTVASDEPIPVYANHIDFDISKLQNWAAFGTAAKAALPTCTFS